MKCWYKTLPVRIHAITVVLSGLLIPAFHAETPLPWYSAFAVFTLVFAAASVRAGCFKSARCGSDKRTDVLHSAVYLSTWTGVNVIAMNTHYPEISLRYFPDLHYLFPVFFLAGTAVIVQMLYHRRLSSAVQGWVSVLIMTALPYTRPLDNYTLGMVLPLMTLLYVLHLSYREIIKIHHPKHFFLLTGLVLAVYCLHASAARGGAFADVVPDLLFFGSAIVLGTVTWLLAGRYGQSLIDIFNRFLFFHGAVLSAMAAAWLIRVIVTVEPAAAVKYRLWISLIHPNAISIYFGAVLFILWSVKVPGKSVNPYRILCAVIAVLTILTQSRTAVIAVLLTLVFVLVLHFRQSVTWLRTGRSKWMTAGVAGLTAILLWRVRYRIFNASTLRDRLALWKPAAEGIKETFFHGGGIPGFGFGSKQKLAAFVTPESDRLDFLTMWMQWDRLGRHFHNLYVETAWLFGWIGLAILIFLIGCVFRVSLTGNRHTGFRNALIVLLLTGLADDPFYYPALMVLFCVLTAIPLGTPGEPLAETDIRTQSTHRKKKPRVFAGEILVVMVLLLIEWGAVMPRVRTHVLAELGTYWDTRDTAYSERCLRAASTAHPPSEPARHLLIQRLSHTHRCDEARTLLNKFSRYSRTDLRLRGWFQEDPLQRTEILEKALNLDPAGIAGPHILSELALSLLAHAPDEGFNQFENALITEDNLLESLKQFGDIQRGYLHISSAGLAQWLAQRDIHLGNCTDALPALTVDIGTMIMELEKSLDTGATSKDLENRRRRLFLTAITAGDYLSASRMANTWKINLSRDWMQSDLGTYADNSPEYALIQASMAFQNGAIDTVEHHLKRAETLRDTTAQWNYLSSRVHIARSHWTEALSAANRALEIEPNHIPARMSRGEILYHLGRNTEALQDLKTVLRSMPWSINAHIYTGIILVENQQYASAYPHLEMVYRMLPGDPWSYYNLYLCLKHLPGRSADADRLEKELRLRFNPVDLPEVIRKVMYEQGTDVE